MSEFDDVQICPYEQSEITAAVLSFDTPTLAKMMRTVIGNAYDWLCRLTNDYPKKDDEFKHYLMKSWHIFPSSEEIQTDVILVDNCGGNRSFSCRFILGKRYYGDDPNVLGEKWMTPSLLADDEKWKSTVVRALQGYYDTTVNNYKILRERLGLLECVPFIRQSKRI